MNKISGLKIIFTFTRRDNNREIRLLNAFQEKRFDNKRIYILFMTDDQLN